MKTIALTTTVVAALLVSSAAFAQEENDSASKSMTAPEGAFELNSGFGYSQGFGNIGKNHGVRLGDLGDAGYSSQLGVGYRIDPRFMVGIYGEFGTYSHGDGTPNGSRVRSVAAGVQAQYHFMPFNKFDPWVGVGSGWRGYWVTSDAVATHSLLGLDALRVTTGVGYRVNESLTITPILGATMTVFTSEQRADRTEFEGIDSPRVNMFVFAGLGGRFDVGGQQVSADHQVASR